MKEEFLHLIWEAGLVSSSDLKTTDGKTISILELGTLNETSGPDFSNARIRIDGIEWFGAIEIHLKSSDWHRHEHSSDALYQSVVLHVVFEHDMEIHLTKDEPIPTLEVRNILDSGILEKYETLKTDRASIPCSSYLNQVEAKLWESTLNEMIKERLAKKSILIQKLLEERKSDWLETYYSLLVSSFGQDINKLPMLELTQKLPLKILFKHLDDPLTIEALLFGVSGFLRSKTDDYGNELLLRYRHLKNLYQLEEVSQIWRLGRVRPENSPVRRLVQFSRLVGSISEAWNCIMNGQLYDWGDIREAPSNQYWMSHYSLGVISKKKLSLGLSKSLAAHLQINVHVPMMFFYGNQTGSNHLIELAFRNMEMLPPESNRYTRKWKVEGRKASHAGHSQGMLELFTQYCSAKKCVNCSIGKSILTRL